MGRSDTINVLHVVPGLYRGGMELALRRIVRGLCSRRMNHSIIALNPCPNPLGGFPKGVKIFQLAVKPRDPLLPLRLRRLIHQVRPSVIHARNWGAWPDVAIARLLSLHPVPLVFSFHGWSSHGPIPLRCRLAFRVLGRLTSTVFTVCNSSRDMIERTTGLSSRRIRVIYNGVDSERFSPSRCKRNVSAGRFVIGTVGSLTPVKNQQALIDASGLLAGQGVDVELRIAGDGPLRERLVQMAEEMKISDRLQMVGHVDRVEEFLGQLDLFVLPSSSEAHPNALLEAMSCGLACVASDVGGVREILDDGRCGVLVNSPTGQEFAQAIARMIASSSRRRELASNARHRVVQHFSMQAMLDSYERLYRQCAAHSISAGGESASVQAMVP